MNPWDAEQIVIERSESGVKGDLFLYAGPDQDVGAVWAEAPGGADAWAKFFQATPKMARALVACGYMQRTLGDREEWHTHACWETLIGEPCLPSCLAAREALKAAGVPIP